MSEKVWIVVVNKGGSVDCCVFDGNVKAQSHVNILTTVLGLSGITIPGPNRLKGHSEPLDCDVEIEVMERVVG